MVIPALGRVGRALFDDYSHLRQYGRHVLKEHVMPCCEISPNYGAPKPVNALQGF